MASSNLTKLEEFLEAQAKAERLREELVKQLRKEILNVQSKVQLPMEELLGKEIVAAISGKPRKKKKISFV